MGVIEKLDIFGQPFAFNVTQERRKYRTNTGAFVTIVCVILTSLGAYIFFSDYLETTSPRVTISSEFLNNYPEIRTFDHSFIPFLSFFSNSGSLPISELSKYVTISVSKIELQLDPLTSQPAMVVKASQNFVNARNAKLSSNKEDFENFLEASGAKGLYDGDFLLSPEDMLDEDFWTIQGSANYLPFTFITLNIFPCSLPDPTQCAPIEDLIQYEVKLSVVFNSYKLDVKHNPVYRLFTFESLVAALNPAAFTVGQVIFKRVEILNEDLDFAKPDVASNFFSIGKAKSHAKFRPGNVYCDTATILAGLCAPYNQILIKSGHEVETVLRLYPKLFGMISELGGFGDLIFIFLGFFYFFYNDYFMKKFVQKNFFRGKTEHIEKVKNHAKKLDEEALKKLKDEYMEEKTSGVEILRKSTQFEGLTLATLDPYYRKTLELIPLLERLKDKRFSQRKKVAPEDALAKVLSSKPKNMVQELIKKKVSSLMKSEETRVGSRNENKIEVFDLDFEGEDSEGGNGKIEIVKQPLKEIKVSQSKRVKSDKIN